jgi:hypothetical protein
MRPGAWGKGAKRAQNTGRNAYQTPIYSCQHAKSWSELIFADLPYLTYLNLARACRQNDQQCE